MVYCRRRFSAFDHHPTTTNFTAEQPHFLPMSANSPANSLYSHTTVKSAASSFPQQLAMDYCSPPPPQLATAIG